MHKQAFQSLRREARLPLSPRPAPGSKVETGPPALHTECFHVLPGPCSDLRPHLLALPRLPIKDSRVVTSCQVPDSHPEERLRRKPDKLDPGLP